ncbi:MAG: helix-turn-helix domain-containing protein [Bdellovibrionota bacterium]
MNLNFTAEEIRQLRYRLGWSQAEMARCLKLEPTMVSSIEAGRAVLPLHYRSYLLQIMNQAESNAERTQRVPIAEVMMKDLGLSQIHDFDVQNRSTDKV